MLEFKFKEEISFKGKIWKLYTRLEEDTPIVLCKNTLAPYQSKSPIFVQIGVIICGEEVIQYPKVIAESKDQNDVMCYALEYLYDEKSIKDLIN